MKAYFAQNVRVTVHVAMPAEAGQQPLNLFVTVCGLTILTPHYPHYNQLVTPAPAADLDSC